MWVHLFGAGAVSDNYALVQLHRVKQEKKVQIQLSKLGNIFVQVARDTGDYGIARVFKTVCEY